MFLYLFKISYDGSKYYGWAKQKDNIKTIQEVIETKFSLIFDKKNKIVGASRTDKGVHAKGQIFTWKSKINLEIKKFQKTFNKIFVSDSIYCLNIKKLKIKNSKENIFKKIYQRQYTYFVNTDTKFNLWSKEYIYQYNQAINLKKLRLILNIFQGKHNFFSFSGLQKDEKINSFREIDKITISKKKKILSIKIKAKSFIRYQIRKIIMSSLLCYQKKINLLDLEDLLKAKDKKEKIKYKAPSCGLYLDWIKIKKV